MGLDIIELIMDLEERFGVAIPDARAERISTVGDLYLFLLEQTRRNALISCPTSQAFYRLRRTFTGELGVDRKRVRLAAPLRDLFPAQTRTTTWPRLAAALGLPDLPDPDPASRGPTAKAFRIALAAVTAGACLLGLLLSLLPGAPVPVGVLFVVRFLAVMLVCFFFGVFWIEGRYLRPVPVPKVRDLVVRLAARDYCPYRDEDMVDATAATIWTDLVAILAVHTGVAADEIHPEQRVVDLVGS